VTWCEQFPDDGEASIARVSAGGVPADQIEAAGVATSRVVLYFHGGGYSLGSARSHRGLGKRIAAEARARVVLPDYRLAPEHVFPAAVEDAVASYRWLLATGVAPEQIAVGGDSAGGGLALALLVSLRDAGAPLPACAVLLSPFADLECRGETYATLAELDPIVSREMGLGMAQAYIGAHQPSNPLASPVRAALDRLPPLLIQVGSREVVLDDARAIERHARQAGVLAKLDVWPGMVHVWHLFASVLEEGQRAIQDLGSFIRQWAKE
jgi:monoterpene epsilon-lactone hydrolase